MSLNLNRFCIVAAHDTEFKAAAGLLSRSKCFDEARMKVCRGAFGDRQVTILQSGVGAFGFAERLSDHLRNNRYEALIVAGVAGALDPQLETGDVVVYDNCHNARAEHPPSVINCNDRLSELIAATLLRSGAACTRGAGVTVDRIITSAAKKLELGTRYRAVAVDMETYDCLSVCAQFDLPATALRVISDDARSELPDFNRALDREGRMNRWRMASALLRNPVNSARFLLNIRRVIDSLRTNLKTIYSVQDGAS
jgi:nucleoside phosphorylase